MPRFWIQRGLRSHSGRQDEAGRLEGQDEACVVPQQLRSLATGAPLAPNTPPAVSRADPSSGDVRTMKLSALHHQEV